MVLHNTCIEMRDVIPRNIDLTIDPSSNKRRPRHELREVLQMTDINQRYFATNSAEAKYIFELIKTLFSFYHKSRVIPLVFDSVKEFILYYLST